ncbi:MAG: UDP-N-acetylenolpyruvoylglucosamine reductase [Bacteroidetes bacterium 4572_77]|nr:MAG: UDP-N-acetylenolpyruvoylglucosamine reductase [Bacteroidetes bacterium 4572_77]
MVHTKTSLKDKCTFKTGATARFYAEINCVEEIDTLMEEIDCQISETIDEIQYGSKALGFDFPKPKLKYYFLGEGSNTLFHGNIDEVVIKNQIKGIKVFENAFENKPELVLLRVGSGELFEDLLSFCLENGYYGLENLSGVPGTVGAAAVGNIGAYGVEQADCFFGASEYNVKDRKTIYRKKKNKLSISKNHIELPEEILTANLNPEVVFSYRHSNIDGFVLSVDYVFSKTPKPILNYRGLDTLPKDISPKELAEEIIRIRDKKIENYKDFPNAGSFFQNPIVPESTFTILKSKFPDLHGFKLDNQADLSDNEQETLMKLSAAQLIEMVGLKGYRNEKYGISKLHSLIIINYNDATGEELLMFSKVIKNMVNKYFSITLHEEVRLHFETWNLEIDKYQDESNKYQQEVDEIDEINNIEAMLEGKEFVSLKEVLEKEEEYKVQTMKDELEISMYNYAQKKLL